MNKIKEIQDILLKNYGPQGWWPLIGSRNKRFEIIIGAILTQNTAWKNVEKALVELNKRKLLDKNKLKSLSVKKLAKLIKPSGYFNQKAKKIKAVIKFLESKKPITRENLLTIWGIGPETADSILLYAYEKPYFVIDAYTKRILSRLGLMHEKATFCEMQETFHASLPKDIEVYKEYHALLVEHAKRYCRTKPLCAECILRRVCAYPKQ